MAVSSVTNATMPLTYNWSTGASTVFVNNLCAGEYTLTVTDANNCIVVDTFTMTQPNEIIITIDSLADIRLSPLGFISISSNGSHTFAWTGPNGFSSSYQDIDNLSKAGCYTLTVTDPATSCAKDTTICLSDFTATFDTEEMSKNIKVYPNPVSDIFTIDFTEIKSSKSEIILYDLSGKQHKTTIKIAEDKMVKIDSKKLQSGLYILKIKLEDVVIYKKLIVGR